MKRLRNKWLLLGVLLAGAALAVFALLSGLAAKEDKPSDELIEIELMIQGTQPPSSSQDYNNVPPQLELFEKMGISLKLNHPMDFQTQVLVRFASDSYPDILCGDYGTLLQPLYNRGLLLPDWTPYLDALPTIKAAMNRTTLEALSTGGRLTCLSDSIQPRDKSLKIRVDWLENLGLAKPETPEELLRVADRMTYSDPDRDGLNNTYAFTSAGYGTGFGDQLESLQCMWGPPDFYWDGDTVSHPMLDGNRKKFLDYVKTIVNERLIDPDWYTQGEEHMQYYLAKTGQIGIAYDSGEILSRTYEMNGSDEQVLNRWGNLVMPREDWSGGKQEPQLPYTNTRTVSRDALLEPERREAILTFLDMCTYPNDGYWSLRWGASFEELTQMGVLMDMGLNNFRYLYRDSADAANMYGSLWDYGSWIDNRNDRVVSSSLPMIENPIVYQAYTMSDQANKFPAYSNMCLNISYDPEVLKRVQAVSAEYELKYVTGQEIDFETYRQDWLEAGGQSMLDAVRQQTASDNTGCYR